LRAGVEEWEEPLHLGSLPATYPTFPHNTTLLAHFFPQPCNVRLPTWPQGALAGHTPVPAPDSGRAGPAFAPRREGRSDRKPPCKPAKRIPACRYDRRMRKRNAATALSLPTPAALVALATALVALVVALAGCGSSASTGTSADPAGVVPASAPVYVGAVVRPDGSLRSDALTAGRKLSGQRNPYARLLGILQTPSSPPLNYSRDVAPWLGPNAGLFFTSLASPGALAGVLGQVLTGGGSSAGGSPRWPFSRGLLGGAKGAIVLDTSDLAAAKKFVADAAAHAKAHSRTYRGVSYEATAGGDAFATVNRFVVLGTETGVRTVIDTARGGSSLKGDSTYAGLQALAPAGALGHLYVNPATASAPSLAGALGAAARAEAAQGARALVDALAGGRPLNVSLVPSPGSIALDADAGPSSGGAGKTTAAQSGGLLAAAATGSRALSELPGESWLAAGLGNPGATLGGGLRGIHTLLTLVSALGSSGAGEGVAAPSSQGTLSVGGLLKGLLTPLSLLGANTAQAKHDFQSWMGDAGVFASGASALELKGGVVIDSTDPSASRAAVAKLGAALRRAGATAAPAQVPGTEAALEANVTGLPLTLVIADGRSAGGQTKFVLGLGVSSIEAALHPSSTMAGSAAYSAAKSTLGEGIAPSIIVEFPTLIGLLEGVGLGEDRTISPFLPYLRAAGTLLGGGKSLGGGAQRLRLVLALQPSAG
jgi:Protein of unknown function (DUF3352)